MVFSVKFVVLGIIHRVLYHDNCKYKKKLDNHSKLQCYYYIKNSYLVFLTFKSTAKKISGHSASKTENLPTGNARL